MNRQPNKERMRKAQLILDDYSKRGLNQEQIAKKYDIPVSVVGQTTRMAGYNHGTMVTTENMSYYNKKAISPIIEFEKFDFLDIYNF